MSLHDCSLTSFSCNKSYIVFQVSSVFTATLEDLCDPDKQAYTKFNTGVVLPLFYNEPYKIWGFTAFILDFCLYNLLPDFYTLRYRQGKTQK